MKMNQFELQRQLLTAQEKIVECRDAFADYASDASNVIEKFNRIEKQILALQREMRAWFAPD
jgi:hypothetical protein